MNAFCSQFLQDENGATAIEYGIMAAGIALTILAGLNALSNAVRVKLFDIVSAAMQ